MHKQDPMSHRIIEKRRRDRMNNCLADLSRLIPTTYLKKFQGRGRIEKTEIIEMAIKHLKHLQSHPCSDPSNCEVAKNTEQDRQRQYQLGFQESMSESIRFLVEIEGFYAENGACIRLINHLQKHYDKLINGHCRIGSSAELESHEGLLVEVMETESMTSRATPDRLLSFSSHQITKDEYHEPTKIEVVPRERRDMSHLSCSSSSAVHYSPETSQLRQMLQNPGVPIDRLRSNSYSTGTLNPGNSSAGKRPSSVSMCSPFNHSNSIHKTDEVYKFKNNIKERFNADSGHSHDSSATNFKTQNNHIQNINSYSTGSTEAGVSPTQSLIVNTDVPSSSPPPSYGCDFLGKPGENSPVAEKGSVSNGWDLVESSSAFCSNRNSSDHGQSSGSSSGYSTGTEMFSNHKYPGQSPEIYSDSPENLSTSSVSPTSQVCNPLIPIFALHPKGTYYIPLSLDAALVTPYVNIFDETLPSLHQISISVNFNCSSRTMDRTAANSWEQPSFYVRERYAKRCGSPDKCSVNVPYSLMARN